MIKIPFLFCGAVMMATLVACGVKPTAGTTSGSTSGSTGGTGGSANTIPANGTASGGTVSTTVTNLPITCAILGGAAMVVADGVGSPIVTTSATGVTEQTLDVTISLTPPAAQTFNSGPNTSGSSVSFNYMQGGNLVEYLAAGDITGSSWSLDLTTYEVGSTPGVCVIHGTLTATVVDTQNSTNGAVSLTF